MRPPPRPAAAAGGPASRLLLALPLGLAAVALVLQFTSHQPTPESAAYGLFNEKEFMRRSDSLPRLERQLRARGGAAGATPAAPRVPLPRGLAGEPWAWPALAATPQAEGPVVAITVTTAESVPQIRVWLAYHRAVGVSLFYLFAEGAAGTPRALAALRAEPGVTVVPADASLSARHARSRIWNETWLSAFFHKPCNHALFVKQSLNMEVGAGLAAADGAHWILHVDTDELIYPGGSRDYSLRALLGAVPPDVDLLVLPNYEALAERDDVGDPFAEVSLFKRNYAHVDREAYFKEYATVARGNPNYFTAYGNGKSAARLAPGLRPNGAHRWHSYIKAPKEWSSDQAAILHYTYNRFSDLRSRRDRCDCAPTEEDAARCFILPFDRLAFLESSLKDDAALMRFFHERLVWREGGVVNELLRKGLLVRLYAPQLMIRGFQEAAAAAGGGAEGGGARWEEAAEEGEAAGLQDGGGGGAAGGVGAGVEEEDEAVEMLMPHRQQPQPQQEQRLEGRGASEGGGGGGAGPDRAQPQHAAGSDLAVEGLFSARTPRRRGGRRGGGGLVQAT